MNIASSFNDIADKYRFSGRAMSQEEMLREQVEARLGLRPSAYAHQHEDDREEKKRLENERRIYSHLNAVDSARSFNQAQAMNFVDGKLAENQLRGAELEAKIKEIMQRLQENGFSLRAARQEQTIIQREITENAAETKEIEGAIEIAQVAAEDAQAHAAVTAEEAGVKLEIQDETMAHARENTLQVAGEDGKFYVVDYVESEYPIAGMAAIQKVYVADADGNLVALDDMDPAEAARHRAAVESHVEGGGYMASRRTAVEGVFSGDQVVADAVEARQEAAAAEQNVTLLQEQHSFLMTRGFDLHAKKEEIEQRIATLEADGATLEEQLNATRAELADVLEERQSLRQLREDIKAGNVSSMEQYQQRLESLGLKEEWDTYNKPENHPYIDYANERASESWAEYSQLKTKVEESPDKSSLETTMDQSRLDELRSEMKYIHRMRSDIMNGRATTEDLDDRMEQSYGDDWAQYRATYTNGRAAEITPVAPQVTPSFPVSALSAASEHDPDGGIGTSGITASAFNSAVTGIATGTPTPAPSTAPDMAMLDQRQIQQQNNMGMGGGMMG